MNSIVSSHIITHLSAGLRAVCCIAALVICTVFAACGPARPPKETPSYSLAPPSEQTVTLVGRFETLPSGDAVRYAWPNSTIAFNFEGTSIAAVLSEDSVRTVGKDTVHNMYEVLIDGEVMPSITVTSTTPRAFTIAEGLAPGPHTARIIKRTEGMVGSGVFHGLELPRETRLLPPPAARERRIEVYGASNEAGYGNLGKANRAKTQTCTYTPATQNAAVAYPALAAHALGAELVNISFSGKGIMGTCTPGDLEPLPALADRIDPFFPKVWPQGDTPAPQVVLLTLGANDFAWGTPNETAFQRAYGAFVRKLRRRYPKAQIICTVTPMIGGKNRVLYGGWLEHLVAATRDPRVHLLTFPVYEGESLGCDWHPDEALHEAMAQQLTAEIGRVTGWQAIKAF